MRRTKIIQNALTPEEIKATSDDGQTQGFIELKTKPEKITIIFKQNFIEYKTMCVFSCASVHMSFRLICK
jgi:hypothetical protein